MGCETAYWLRYEYGREVSVIEMMSNFMEGVCTANRGHLLHYMKNEVELINCARVTSFEPGEEFWKPTGQLSACLRPSKNPLRGDPHRDLLFFLRIALDKGWLLWYHAYS